MTHPVSKLIDEHNLQTLSAISENLELDEEIQRLKARIGVLNRDIRFFRRTTANLAMELRKMTPDTSTDTIAKIDIIIKAASEDTKEEKQA